jgi:hypothetical protein
MYIVKADTPLPEIEEAIAMVFGRKYKMIAERVPGSRPNFYFYESAEGIRKGKRRGSAFVVRMYGNMKDMDLGEVGRLTWGDTKGIVLIGFNDVCAFKAMDRINFTIISRRTGLYE